MSARNSLCVLAALAGALPGAAPVLRDLEPRGAQRGSAFTLTLTGSDLVEGAKVLSYLPASFAPLTPKAGSLPFLVELKPDAPVGLYQIGRAHV